MASSVMYPFFVACIAAIVTASAHLSSLTSLETSKVMAGEVWRLFSGHVTHLTWSQYAIDAPVFILLFATYGNRFAPSSAILLSLFAALSVSLTVILAGVHEIYGGLSGVSCAAVSALLLGSILEQPSRRLPYLLCFLFSAYLMFFGGFASGVRVAYEAHIAGAGSGLIFMALRRHMKKQAGSPVTAGQTHLLQVLKKMTLSDKT